MEQGSSQSDYCTCSFGCLNLEPLHMHDLGVDMEVSKHLGACRAFDLSSVADTFDI